MTHTAEGDHCSEFLECVGGPWDGRSVSIPSGTREVELVQGPIGYHVTRPDGRVAHILPEPKRAGRYVVAGVELRWEPAP